MTNSRAGKSKMVLLDHHLATGTESTYTYTPSPALDMKTIYREVMMIITGSATAALSIMSKINANTDYDDSNNLSDTTTMTTAIATAGGLQVLCGSSLIDGANRFYIKVHIVFNDAGDHLLSHVESSAPHEGNTSLWSEDQSTDTTITTLQTYTSTSTWIAGTEITTYGIKR